MTTEVEALAERIAVCAAGGDNLTLDEYALLGALVADARRYAYCKTLEGQCLFITIIRNKGADELDAAIDAATQENRNG